MEKDCYTEIKLVNNDRKILHFRCALLIHEIIKNMSVEVSFRTEEKQITGDSLSYFQITDVLKTWTPGGTLLISIKGDNSKRIMEEIVYTIEKFPK